MEEVIATSELEVEICQALNKHSAENESDTPDFLLAQFLTGCLKAFNRTTGKREAWHGRNAVEPSADPVPSAVLHARKYESKHEDVEAPEGVEVPRQCAMCEQESEVEEIYLCPNCHDYTCIDCSHDEHIKPWGWVCKSNNSPLPEILRNILNQWQGTNEAERHMLRLPALNPKAQTTQQRAVGRIEAMDHVIKQLTLIEEKLEPESEWNHLMHRIGKAANYLGHDIEGLIQTISVREVSRDILVEDLCRAAQAVMKSEELVRSIRAKSGGWLTHGASEGAVHEAFAEIWRLAVETVDVLRGENA